MGEEAMQDLLHWLHAAGGSSLASFAPPGVSHEELWWPGLWASSPHRRARQQRCVPRRPVRGRRGSKSGFACHGYTLPQPNYQQMSTGAPPACSLIYGRRSREGKVRGSRGGSNKHGYYTCKYNSLCSSSAFPLIIAVYFPVTNKLVAVLHVSGCKGPRGEKGSRCGLLLLRVLGVSIPARGCVWAEPLPTPACTAGWEPRGSPEAARCVWDGEQSRCFTSPPTRADFLLGVFTSFPRQLPMGTSQTETPVRLPMPMVRHILPIYLPPGAAASKESSYGTGICRHWSPFERHPQLWYLWPQVDAAGEAEVCLPLQIGSKPAEQLWC